MKFFIALLVSSLFLLVGIFHVQNWDFTKLKIGPHTKTNWSFTPDPELPNVLILGDSISIGYTLEVRKSLEGKANVYRPTTAQDNKPQNCGGTINGVKNIDQWLGNTKWAIIHFNWGLHDLKHVKKPGTNIHSNNPKDPTQTTVEAYTQNLEIITKKLKATGAQLIFATTTPVAPKTKNPLRKPEYPPRYNAAAVAIMNSHGIRINDLHSYCMPNLKKWQQHRDVHFKHTGSKALADQISKVILDELETQSK